MVREFRLINEKGQEYPLMDIENHILLTDPLGLGYSYSTDYQQIGETFITNLRKLEQGKISGTANFREYDNFKEFIDFVESSESLKFGYKIPYKNGSIKEYFKGVSIQSISKTQKQINGFFSETVNFDCLSLWYEENTVVYTVEQLTDEIRWDFTWDSYFSDYDSRNLQYINQGHIEAPVYIEMSGYLLNPKIELYIDSQLYQTVEVTVEIEEYEKLIYDTRVNHFQIAKQKTDGTIENLFDLDNIDFPNNNVIRIPKNKSCEIKLTADNDVLNAKVTIYPQYKAV